MQSLLVLRPFILQPTPQPQPNPMSTKPQPLDVDVVIRAEYDAWTARFGKKKEDKRYDIFRANFIAQMEWNRKTGQFYLLNEFGDMTPDEYEAMNTMNTRPPFVSSVREAEEVIPAMTDNNFVTPFDEVGTTIKTITASDFVVDFETKEMEAEASVFVEDDVKEWQDFSFAMDFDQDDDEEENNDEEESFFDIAESDDETEMKIDAKQELLSSPVADEIDEIILLG